MLSLFFSICLNCFILYNPSPTPQTFKQPPPPQHSSSLQKRWRAFSTAWLSHFIIASTLVWKKFEDAGSSLFVRKKISAPWVHFVLTRQLLHIFHFFASLPYSSATFRELWPWSLYQISIDIITTFSPVYKLCGTAISWDVFHVFLLESGFF